MTMEILVKILYLHEIPFKNQSSTKKWPQKIFLNFIDIVDLRCIIIASVEHVNSTKNLFPPGRNFIRAESYRWNRADKNRSAS